MFALTLIAAFAVKFALVAPVPINTDPGTVTAEFPPDKLTTVLEVAALVSVTVQVELPGGVKLPGLHVRLFSTGAAVGGSSDNVAAFDIPFHVALNSAEALALTALGAFAVNVALVAPVPIVIDPGTVTAVFPLDRLTTMLAVAGLVSVTVQVELPGGVNSPGLHATPLRAGTAAGFSVSVAVFDVPFHKAVKSADVLVFTGAVVVAVKVPLVAPVGIVTDPSTLTATFPLDTLTTAVLVAALVRVTVQVELPGGVKVPGLQAKLLSTGTAAGGLSVNVADLEVPFKLAVKSGVTIALTALAALAVKVAPVPPVPIVTDPGTVTAAFPLDRLTTMLAVAGLVSATVHVELPGAVNAPGLQARLLSTGTAAGGLRVNVAVLDVPFQLAINSGVTTALTALAALAVNVTLVAPVPIVTDPGTVTAALPLDRLTTVLPVAALDNVTVQVELPGAVNAPGLHARLLRTGTGGFRVNVAVFDVPLNVAVNTGEVTAPTALAAVAVNVALVAPVPIVTDPGTVTAALPLDRLTTVLPIAAPDSVTVQVELPGAVNAPGLQVRLLSTRTGGLRVSVAVLEVPLNVAVNTGEVTAPTALAAVAVNVALVAPVPIVTDPGTVTAALPLDRLTTVLPVAALDNVTVQVELPGAVNAPGLQVRLLSVGAGGFRVNVAVFDVPLNVAVNTGEVTAPTALAAVAVKVALMAPVPIVTDPGTVTAALPLDRLTTVLPIAAPDNVTVQVELPGAVNAPGLQARLLSTDTGGFRVNVAVFDVPLSVAVKTGEVTAPTALAAVAVKVALMAPVPIVTDPGTVTAALPLDKLTTVLPIAAPDSVTVQVELPGAVNAPGLQVRLLSTRTGGLRVSVAVLEVPLNVAVNTGEVTAPTALAAVAVNVALVAPVPIVTDPGTVTAALPLDKLTTVLPIAAPDSVTVQVELPGAVNAPGLHARLLRTGTGGFRVNVAVLEVPLNVAVNTGEVTAPTALAAVAVNVALVAPVPIVTDPGTVTAALPLDKLTTVLPIAAPDSVTVQVELPGAVNAPGLQVRLLSTRTGGLRVSVAVFDVPLNVAVNTGEVTAPTALAAVAVKVALVAPVPIVTDPGTVTAALPLDRLTTVLPIAAPDSVTVQVELPGAVNAPGLQARLLSVGAGGFRVNVAVFDVPLNVAVNTGEVTAPTALAAVAVNVALVAPVPIVTDPGTVTAALPLDRLTTVLPIAAPDSVTVQVELPGAVNAPGLQVRLLNVGAGVGWLIVILVPLPVRPRLLPLPSVAERFESVIDDEVFVVVGDMWKVATPSVPLGTSVVVEVRLMIRQFALLAPVEHENISPDMALTPDDAAIVTELKSVEE